MKTNVQSFTTLHWFVFVTDRAMLLGDTVSVFENRGKRRFKPVHDHNDDIQRVLLPISSNRLLVGTPHSSHFGIDLQVVNKAVVRCSYEFFVSPVALPASSVLPASIGEWSGIFKCWRPERPRQDN